MKDPNKIQLKAQRIANDPGNYMVEAVPGSGKTMLAVAVSGAVAGPKIIITLQNRCVDELNERLRDSGSTDGATTIHSFGFQLAKLDWRNLGFSGKPRAWDSDETKQEFLLFTGSLNDQELTPDELWRLYQKWSAWGGYFKDNAKRVGIKWEIKHEVQVQHAFDEWADHKQAVNRVDFHDMVRLPLKVLNRPKAQRYVQKHTALICDELQDSSRMQLRLIIGLMKLVKTSVLVGDSLQSIYGWAGGMGNPFEYVKERVGSTTLRLEYSLRLTKEIAEFVLWVMRDYYPDLELKTTRNGPRPKIRSYDDRIGQYNSVAVRIGRLLEKGVDPGDIVVVARSNASLRMMGDMLERYDVAYIRQLQSKEAQRLRNVLRGLLSFLRVMVHRDERALTEFLRGHTDLDKKIIEYLAREQPQKLKKEYGIPRKHKHRVSKCWRVISNSLEITDAEVLTRIYQNTFGGKLNTLDPNGLFRYIQTLGIDLDGMDHAELLDLLEEMLKSEKQPEQQVEHGVELLTIHRAKGGGWKYVFLIDIYEGGLPHFKNLKGREELRNFFVEITRSSRYLFISGIRQETWASTIEGKREEDGAHMMIYGKQLQEVLLDESGNVMKRASKPNHKATSIMSRKTCRYIDKGESIHGVADVRRLTYKRYRGYQR